MSSLEQVARKVVVLSFLALFTAPALVTAQSTAPSGTISAAPTTCTIPAGQSNCTTVISWSAKDTSTASVYVGSQNFAGGVSGSQNAPWITPNGSPYTFTLKDSGGNTLSSVQVNGVCASGSAWNGGSCAASGSGSGSGSGGSSTLPNLTVSKATPATGTFGAPTTYTATVSNNGGTSTGGSFKGFFQVHFISLIDSTDLIDEPVQTVDTLAAGSSAIVSFSYTPNANTAATQYIRFCADKSNRNDTGTITESDESDNCGYWTALSIAGGTSGGGGSVANTQSCHLSAAKNSDGSYKLSYTFTGGSDYLINIDGAGTFYSSGSTTVNPSGTVTYTGNVMKAVDFSPAPIYGTCSTTITGTGTGGGGGSGGGDNGGGGTSGGSGSGSADLTVGSVSPTVALANSPTLFSALISNIGTGGTGAGFTNYFQKATDSSGTGATTIGRSVMSALSAGGSANTSVSYAFVNSGTYYVRACADQGSGSAGDGSSGSGGGGTGDLPASCANLAKIGTGTDGKYWTRRTAPATVTYGASGGTVSNIDPMDYTSIWSYRWSDFSNRVPWPGNSGAQIQIALGKTEYLSQKFTVPTNYTGTTAQYYQVGSGGWSGFTATVSQCPGDFGQTGTVITQKYCKADVQALAGGGLGVVVNDIQQPSTCTLKPGGTYYLNILPEAALPQNDVSISRSSANNTPWMVVYNDVEKDVCGSHYVCNVGTSGNNVDTGTAYTWTCTRPAGQGSIRVACSENKSSVSANETGSRGGVGGAIASVGRLIAAGAQRMVSTVLLALDSSTPAPDLVTGFVTPTTAAFGKPTTFSADVSNVGTASTGTSFKSFFQVSYLPPLTSDFFIDESAQDVPALAAGESKTLSFSYTPEANTAADQYIRLCADKSDRNTFGPIQESNEQNNCTHWTHVTITGATATGGGSVANTQSCHLSAAKNSDGSYKLSYTFTGGSDYLINIDGAGTFYSSGSTTVNPSGTVTYTGNVMKAVDFSPAPIYGTCSTTITGTGTGGGGGSGGGDNGGGGTSGGSGAISESNEQNNCGPWTPVIVSSSGTGGTGGVGGGTSGGTADLTAGAITPSSVGTNITTKFSASIINNGTGSTGDTFSNVFQVAQSGTPADDEVLTFYPTNPSTNPLSQGASETDSFFYTFTNSGNYYMRACADMRSAGDMTGNISESNKGNNCGPWTPISVIDGYNGDGGGSTGGDNTAVSCTNLAQIGTGTAGKYWTQLTRPTTVYYGGFAVSTKNTDPTDYNTIWSYPSVNGSPASAVMWPGAGGSTRMVQTSDPYQYISEKFTVPANYSGTKGEYASVGSGNWSNYSASISKCPGDFGQTGTVATSHCLMRIENSSSGLRFIGAPTQQGAFCTLTPGETYYLNILPEAELPLNDVSTSRSNAVNQPWMVYYYDGTQAISGGSSSSGASSCVEGSKSGDLGALGYTRQCSGTMINPQANGQKYLPKWDNTYAGLMDAMQLGEDGQSGPWPKAYIGFPVQLRINANQYASFKFNTGNNGYSDSRGHTYAGIQIATNNSFGATANWSISTVPGDMFSGTELCRSSYLTASIKQGTAADCKLQPNTDYYLNVAWADPFGSHGTTCDSSFGSIYSNGGCITGITPYFYSN